MKKLKDMLEEKDSKDNGDMEKDAKLSALKELRGIASKAMGEGMKSKMDGMSKVTVASDDKAGLVKGLEKAKALMEKSPEEIKDETDVDESCEDEETSEELSDVEEMDMSQEQIDAMIKALQMKKAKLTK